MTTKATQYGLSPDTIKKIVLVFAEYPQIEQAILYGSRAKGNYRNGSDIDLVLHGKDLTHLQLLSIENALDELLLPYKIDLSLLREIDNPDLISHIKRVGVMFYVKDGETIKC